MSVSFCEKVKWLDIFGFSTFGRAVNLLLPLLGRVGDLNINNRGRCFLMTTSTYIVCGSHLFIG